MNEIEITQEIGTAVKAGDADRVALLIADSAARLKQMTPFGTWLHVAAKGGKIEVVERLIAMGGDVNARGGTFGGAAINLAASEGHTDVVRCLLDAGAEMDVSEPERNPLFGAIYGGHLQVVKLLVERGIDPHVRYTGESMKDMDAVAFARQRGQSEIAVLLDRIDNEGRTTESQPSETDWRAIRAASEAAVSFLKIAGDEPESVQAKIEKMVASVVDGRIENPLGEDLAVALGALWGNSLCEEYGWQWIVPIHGEWRSLGVADPERKYLALPFNLFSRLIDERDQETPGTFVRYRAIGAGHLPASSPGTYTIITT